MSALYGMQRANGDWFGVKYEGRLRMPVFRSSSDAMQARVRNAGMLLFKPVVLDENALEEIAETDTAGSACFWLVNNPADNLRHAHPLEHVQLALLVQDAVPQLQG
ncbi:MAG: hypothetical protein WBP93_06585 [Pyrinomonadaceae bacterium]